MTAPSLPDFAGRHIGPRDHDVAAMLETVGHPTLESCLLYTSDAADE